MFSYTRSCLRKLVVSVVGGEILNIEWAVKGYISYKIQSVNVV